MKPIVAAACMAILAGSAIAQETEDERGLSLMERGAQMLMEGLMREMEPAMDDLQGLAEEFGPAMRDFATQMGPALRGLLEEVEDWSVYHPPEKLENGDIIIRRKTPEELQKTPDTDTEIEI
ncbi:MULTISPECIES: hypothetical protein [Roseobacteraceae]|uniref:hypothetical protein n=1 Tax=Roseobacteraceae TaxID=2854170 RepID=UPI001C45BF8B|nr:MULTISPECIES: hypothetical protein [Roseobacteraceae]MBV7408923.1 hypothetical protein [Maritimibacter sp. DP1N21-5]MBY5934390.1 hypothetical protein [Tateyamaria omphalii]